MLNPRPHCAAEACTTSRAMLNTAAILRRGGERELELGLEQELELEQELG